MSVDPEDYADLLSQLNEPPPAGRSSVTSRLQGGGLASDASESQNINLGASGDAGNYGSSEVPTGEDSTRTSTNLYRSGAYTGVPLNVNVDTTSYVPPPKVVGSSGRYKLFQAPVDLEELTQFCFLKKGRGNNFLCIKKNCTTAHQGLKVSCPVVPGEAFVVRDRDTAFLRPSMDLNLLDDELRGQWLSESRDLDGWTDLMGVAIDKVKQTDIASNANVKVSPRGLEEQADKRAKAMGFKTPRMKRELADDDSTIDEIKIEEKSPIDESDWFKGEGISDEIKQLIKLLDGNMGELRESLRELWRWKSSETKFTSKLSVHSDTMFEHLEKIIGSKTGDYPGEFDSSDVWGACEVLAHQMKGLPKELKAECEEGLRKVKIEVRNLLNDLETEKQDRIKATEDAKSEMSGFPRRLTRVEKFAMDASKMLKSQINDAISKLLDLENELHLKDLERDDSSHASKRMKGANDRLVPISERTETSLWEVFDGLDKKLERLTKSVTALETNKDKGAVKFGGLGFRNVDEVGAWLEINDSTGAYGWVYDFHTLMQAVFNMVSGEDLIKRLSKGYKLDIEDGHQAATIASFEVAVPRFFSANPGHTVTQRDQSFFSSIKSWAEWDLPNEGFREQLMEAINHVRTAHLNNIQDNLDPDSAMYQKATEALQTTHSFATAFVKMGDDIYRTHVRAKFGSAVAFHVQTRLMRVIMLEVFKPRRSVAMSLKAANQAQIAKVTLLASLRSLDIMREIQDVGFTNHPIIANELVKFLAVNTEFQSVRDLQSVTGTLTNELNAVRKELGSLVKAHSTASNKHDALRSEITALTKRVKALES